MPDSKSIDAWADDPENGVLLRTLAPGLKGGLLPVSIQGTAPVAAPYPSDDRRFRWWNAAESLRRVREAWAPLVPPATRWMTGKSLPVVLDAGDELNAYYDRETLSFFHSKVAGRTIYSGESPDIVAHEFGHAVLDALQPALFDAMSTEAAAFHEAFGDVSAILSALQVPDVRAALLDETGGQLHRSSRVSRIAEQLGWALRHRTQGAAEPDCLRNAANAFYYKDPNTLEAAGSASMLTSQPHSFSRVFTGAFLELLNGAFQLQAGAPSDVALVKAGAETGQLLVDAVLSAPVVPEYFAQVAAAMVRADARRYQGRYGNVLRSAFTRRGILSIQSATGLSGGGAAAAGAALAVMSPSTPAALRRAHTRARELPIQAFPGALFGIDAPALVVCSPDQDRTYAAAASALDVGSLEPPSGQLAARAFLEDLYRRGRIETHELGGPSALVHPFTKKTHELRPHGNALFVGRRCFDCGLDPAL